MNEWVFLVWLFCIFLCWGSFLNVLAYRLVREDLAGIVTKRSRCPYCKSIIKWYDLIPVLSWILLRGKCRNCQQPISTLYPLIELLTALLLTYLFVKMPFSYFGAYFIFCSALIVTIRSDLETMLISRFVTLFLVPLGIYLSHAGYLPLTGMQSFFGALFGYGILKIASLIFLRFTGIQGIGVGDLDLLCFIGAFTGLYGAWISLLIGSLLGSAYGIAYMKIFNPERYFKIPFGPFLAVGALCFIFFKEQLMQFLLGM